MLARRLVSPLVLGLSVVGRSAFAIQLPPDFVAESVTPGTTFDTPTSIAFLPDGRLLVAEKRGRLQLVSGGVKSTAWSAEREVLDHEDRGLVAVAIDPAFATNRRVYLLYVVDPDSDGVDDDPYAFGRLARYQLSNSGVLDPATRTILMGRDWRNGPVCTAAHAVDGLRWGSDGTLLVSVGEGAHYQTADRGGQDDAMFGPGRTDPAEDIGAYRAQYPGSLAGKILRLDPVTGRGLASNPFFDGDADAPRSKVWAYGLRNPFRFAVRAGTGSANPLDGRPGTLYVGDVGWFTWEEIDVVRTPGENFGWPCDEGPALCDGYATAIPNHHGCASIGTVDNPSPKLPPVASWHHDDPDRGTPAGFAGNCVVAGVFYDGTRYPAAYRGPLWIADYGRNWIRLLVTDGQDRLVECLPFAEDAEGPVDFAVDPTSHDIHYVSILTGQVRRIRYTGATTNHDPVAAADASPDAGLAPLRVAFSSAGSFDPDADPLTTTWLFGDGAGSADPHPAHTYETPGVYAALLTVTDGRGGLARDTVVVQVGGPIAFPGTPLLDDFQRPDGPLGGGWLVSGSAVVVRGGAMGQVGEAPAWALWPEPFGPAQEARMTFVGTSRDAQEQSLLLRVQGTTREAPHVAVHYDASARRLRVSTWDPAGGWRTRAGPLSVRLRGGDQLGARIEGDGRIEVFKNRVAVLGGSLEGWAWATAGGRIGVGLTRTGAARVDDFGGGSATAALNHAPTLTIASPADHAFFGPEEAIALRAVGSDAEDAASRLQYRWDVRVHHNNHIHPVLSVERDTASFIATDHDDGTGYSIETQARVTDSGGLTATATAMLYPEVDLAPVRVAAAPDTPGTADPIRFTVVIRNDGRMPAPLSRWRLVTDGVTIAEGDARAPARDSATASAYVAPHLAPGRHTLSLVVDPLGTVPETDEGNNALAAELTVVERSVAPAAVATLSPPFPNPTRGRVELMLELPAPARVEFQVLDLLGRRVWAAAPRAFGAGAWPIAWSGEDAREARMPPGLYLARVRVGSLVITRRIALLP